MKKRNFISKLTLKKVKVSNFKSPIIGGGRSQNNWCIQETPASRATCFCPTNADCVYGTVANCETIQADCGTQNPTICGLVTGITCQV